MPVETDGGGANAADIKTGGGVLTGEKRSDRHWGFPKKNFDIKRKGYDCRA